MSTKYKTMILTDYIKETAAELKHVSWPSRKQTLAFTIIVILVSLATAIFLSFFDGIFTAAIKHFLP